MEIKTREKKGVREVFAGDEISISELLGLFTSRIRFVYISGMVCLIIGTLVAATSPVEYEAESQVISEDATSGGGSMGGLAGLAGLAGIALPSEGSGSAGLSPDMYPTIVASQPFLMDLMEESFYFQEKGKEMTLYEYFVEERPGHIFSKVFTFIKGIPNRVVSLLEQEKSWTIPQIPVNASDPLKEVSPRILNVTWDQRYVMSQLESRIKIDAAGKIVTLKVKMPEPYLSAELNNIVLEKVIDYVIAYKTDKQRENLEFIEERTQEAKDRFVQAQLELARFRDANMGIVTATARTKEEQLQAGFNLAFNVYNGLALELEQTKIKLKENTPLFTEFEPVTVPLKNSEPNILAILIVYILLGVVVGGAVIIFSLLLSYKQESAVLPADE